jgi:hypothetical protein
MGAGAGRRLQRPGPCAIHAECHLHKPVTHQHAFQSGGAQAFFRRILGLETCQQAAHREGYRVVGFSHDGCFRRLMRAA